MAAGTARLGGLPYEGLAVDAICLKGFPYKELADGSYVRNRSGSLAGGLARLVDHRNVPSVVVVVIILINAGQQAATA